MLIRYLSDAESNEKLARVLRKYIKTRYYIKVLIIWKKMAVCRVMEEKLKIRAIDISQLAG